MKSLLIAIKPKYISMILNKTKTIEVRKRFPKDYKGWVYIYCTKDEYFVLEDEKDNECENYYIEQFVTVKKTRYTEKQIKLMHVKSYNGKVVARFYCDKVEEIRNRYCRGMLIDSCLSNSELNDYLGKKNGYAIHISDLEIFDKPKELGEFKHLVVYHCNNCPYKEYGMHNICTSCEEYVPLKRPFQSWCYVEVEE